MGEWLTVSNEGNISSAVRQQRKEPKSSLDDFPTPPFGTRALLGELLAPRVGDLSKLTAWEPTCNRGYMARPLAERFGKVITSDVKDYGWTGQQHVLDFLTAPPPEDVEREGVDWIIFNPPFAKADAFVARALALKPRGGVAMICRGAFLEGGDRYRDLFSKHMPWIFAQHVERVPMNRGRFDPQDGTATAYAWFVWRPDWNADHYIGTWIEKCRDRYERPDDVNFEMRDGTDWIAKTIADTPLFAHEGGR